MSRESAARVGQAERSGHEDYDICDDIYRVL